jgi:GTPase
MLVHLVDLAPLEGDPASNYEAVRAELGSYGAGLDRLPELIVLSKSDLLPPDDVGMAIKEWRGRRGSAAVDVLAVSSATGAGVEVLGQAILRELPGSAQPVQPAAGPRPTEFEAEHRIYRPAGEGGYWVEREDDGGFRVMGRGVELLFERHDLSNEEALAYLEARLNEIGVVAALRAAGFEPGDDVKVGEHVFELHP